MKTFEDIYKLNEAKKKNLGDKIVQIVVYDPNYLIPGFAYLDDDWREEQNGAVYVFKGPLYKFAQDLDYGGDNENFDEDDDDQYDKSNWENGFEEEFEEIIQLAANCPIGNGFDLHGNQMDYVVCEMCDPNIEVTFKKKQTKKTKR